MSSLAAIEWYEKNKLNLSSLINTQEYVEDNRSKNGLNLSTTIEFDTKYYFAIFFTIVIACVLVQSTTDVIGKDLIGYLKAISLEVGILLVIFKKAESFVEKMFKFLLMSSIYVFTGLILHTGAERSISSDLTSLVKNDPIVALSMNIADKRLGNLNGMSDSYITLKDKSLDKLEDLKIDLQKRMSDIQASSQSKSLQVYSDLACRLILMSLNIFLCHFWLSKRKETVKI